LFPLRLEVAAHGLDRQLEALDSLALLPEGQLLIGVGNAEHKRLVLDLGERGVPLLQRLLRRLTSDALPLQRRPGVGEGGLLLLEPPLGSLAGGALLQKPLLGDGERRNLGVEGRLQVVGLLGPLL
jgi:hypothetical protein